MNESKYNNLIVKHFSGELSKGEEIALQNWIAESTENNNYFQKISDLLKKTQPSGKPVLPDINDEWNKLEKNLDLGTEKESAAIIPLKKQETTRPNSLKPGILKWHRYAIAASFFIVVLVGALWVNYQASHRFVVVETQNSETRELLLADGTTVKLNSASKIEYLKSFSDSTRQLNLTGEAFFSVVPEDRKFIVKTKNNRISVLGTKFNIWSRNDITRVIVKEGKVSFEHSDFDEGERFILKANQMAVSKHNQIEKPIDLTDTESLLGWLKGRIVFNKAGLQEVAEELSRIYDINMKLENPILADLSISGTFEKKPIKDILEAICLTLDLQFRFESDVYTIY
ncbi:FecR domain-containing protein [candidate division KSB1 bacterium]|nr:FecR domain-containing protein [candidate division KSB1 bacterium]